MRINGEWQYEPDDPTLVRPTIPADIAVAEERHQIVFLVDTGADLTVIGSAYAQILYLYRQDTEESFMSASGNLAGFIATVRIVFEDSVGREVGFKLPCLVLTDTLQANCHLLGRDILDHFALICDREAGFVTLLRTPHHYTIQG